MNIGKFTRDQAEQLLASVAPLAPVAGSEAFRFLKKYAESQIESCVYTQGKLSMTDPVKYTIESAKIFGQRAVWTTLANLRAVIPQTVSQLEARLALLRKEKADGDGNE